MPNTAPSSSIPTIGLTLDYETGGGYSKLPWYAIRENYCSAISDAGGLPLPLPHEASQAEHYLDLLDGLLTTGGNFDVPPEYYGEVSNSPTVLVKQKRSEFEFAVMRGAIARGMPVFGICGGQQLLNVVLGGTLIQHIPDTIENPLPHEQPNPRTEPGHTVAIADNTLLARIVGVNEMAVNSAHHQAVAKVAPNCIVNAVAPDGVIEGIESTEHPFCLGVQWHPEYAVDPNDTTLFDAFVAAAATYRAQKKNRIA